MKQTLSKVLVFCIITCSVVFEITPLNAQSQKETLTNSKIIELVRMGIGEALIVAKIKRSACRCDTSTEAIAKLKNARVSDAIILAMIETSVGPEAEFSETTENLSSIAAKPINSSPVVSNSGDSSEAALERIREPGIYLFENGTMKSIEASVFSGGKVNPLLSTLTYGIKKAKWRAKVRGRSANLQAADSRPVFYFVFNPELKNSGATMAGLFWGMPATSPNEFIMVQMQVKDSSREAVLGEYGMWTGASMGARDKDVREYLFEKINAGIYKVVPKVQLAPGEYCFYYAGNVTGIGFAGGKIFDFSVR